MTGIYVASKTGLQAIPLHLGNDYRNKYCIIINFLRIRLVESKDIYVILP